MLGSPLRWKAIAKELSSAITFRRTVLNRSALGAGFKCQTNGLTGVRSTWSFVGQCRKYSAPSHSQTSTFSVVSATARKCTRFDPRFFSSNANTIQDTNQLPVLSPPTVGRWLMGSACLVFAVIVVGGVTRLTESGLSITEWKPIYGIIPPLNQEDW